MERRLTGLVKCILLSFEAAALDKRQLKTALTSLKNHSSEIIGALDAVLSGV